jgi:pyridoxamine 5'-phosphate oxidase family protein
MLAAMTTAFTEAERAFLTEHGQGRLATVTPSGSPQVKPVGYAYNADLGAIEIAGYAMAESAKFRNIVANPRVAFVVDDVLFEGVEGARFVEIRGYARAARRPAPAESGLAAEIIRIHPRRVLSFNVDPARPGLLARDVPARDVPARDVPARDVTAGRAEPGEG